MRVPIVVAGALLLGIGAVFAAAPLVALPPQLPPAERGKLEEIIRSPFASTRVEQPPYVARAEIW